jgi:hypothetical protein
VSSRKQHKESRSRLAGLFEKKIKTAGSHVLDTLNPVQKASPTNSKIILFLTILFSLLALYEIYLESHIARLLVLDPSLASEPSMYIYFIPSVYLTTATVLFYLRKKAGWIMLGILLCLGAYMSIALAYQAMTWEPSGLPAMDNLYPRPSVERHLMTLVFAAGCLWAICRKEMREVYKITGKMIVCTIGVAVVVGILLAF